MPLFSPPSPADAITFVCIQRPKNPPAIAMTFFCKCLHGATFKKTYLQRRRQQSHVIEINSFNNNALIKTYTPALRHYQAKPGKMWRTMPKPIVPNIPAMARFRLSISRQSVWQNIEYAKSAGAGGVAPFGRTRAFVI